MLSLTNTLPPSLTITHRHTLPLCQQHMQPFPPCPACVICTETVKQALSPARALTHTSICHMQTLCSPSKSKGADLSGGPRLGERDDERQQQHKGAESEGNTADETDKWCREDPRKHFHGDRYEGEKMGEELTAIIKHQENTSKRDKRIEKRWNWNRLMYEKHADTCSKSIAWHEADSKLDPWPNVPFYLWIPPNGTDYTRTHTQSVSPAASHLFVSPTQKITHWQASTALLLFSIFTLRLLLSRLIITPCDDVPSRPRRLVSPAATESCFWLSPWWPGGRVWQK